MVSIPSSIHFSQAGRSCHLIRECKTRNDKKNKVKELGTSPLILELLAGTRAVGFRGEGCLVWNKPI